MLLGTDIMKSKIRLSLITLLLLLLMQNFLSAAPSFSLFEEGNQLYDSSDSANTNYQKAIQKYNELLESGYENGEIYYNLGNAYYKLGDIANCIASYKRAERFIGNDDDLKKNLKIAQLSLVDKIEEKPILPIWKFFDKIINKYNVYTVRNWIIYLSFVLSALIVFLIFIHNKKIKTVIYALSLVCVVFLTGIFFISLKISEEYQNREGIINFDKVTIFSSPDENINSVELFNLHRGAKVKIEKNIDSWLEISVSKGKKGWVKREFVIEI